MILVSYYGYMFRSFFRPSSGQRTQLKVQSVRTVYCAIQYYLQGVRENN